ncbi:MAG TPA: TIM barrel protein, partial [Thermomicrobiales bacterium]|nr:TIM barrel protein [Thermomicrobiales bacterium]
MSVPSTDANGAMYPTIGPEALGIRGLSLPAAIDLARDAGFAGLAFGSRAAADLIEQEGLAAARQRFAQAGVKPALWSLPVAWRDDERWQADLSALPRLAAAACGLGSRRTATYMPSGSDERPYRENFDWHVARLRPIAAALKAEDCRLGLEFIGTKTYRDAFRYPFIHTLDETMELIAAIGTGNVGLMLDSWHVYASGGSAADLDRLTNDDVVVVHVNDAPAGVTREAQIDTVRTLPLETGVIDLVGFMTRLRAIGYDGPVMPEPFSQRLVDLAARDPLA